MPLDPSMCVGSPQEPTGWGGSTGLDPDRPPIDPAGPPDDATPVQSGTASRASARLSLGMPPMQGDFRPIRQLGAGSFGEVWLAEKWVDGRNFRRVAVKFLDAGQREAATTLYLEASRLATLAGKGGIVQIHEVVLDAERPYFTMDYAPEGSLAGLIAGGGPLPLASAVTIFRGIVEALESLHLKGIIHCDLKPENILLGDRHEPMIADFGQSRLRGKGPPNTGSWFYMAPEQIAEDRAHDAETSCDVYALGAIFYKLLTGKEPRSADHARSLLDAEQGVRDKLKVHLEWILNAPTPVDHHRVGGIDRPLRSIVDRCLETDPTRRFRDGSAVLSALEQRERSLRKRPLIIRGLLATLALMAVLLGVLLCVIPMILANFRKAYVGESLRRDSIAAHLASDVVEDILLDRKSLTANWAADPDVGAALSRADSKALHEILKQLVRIKREEKSEAAEFEVLSISAYNRIGGRIALVADMSDQDVGKGELFDGVLWNWRDWFNGMGRDQEPRAEPYPPIESVSISSPYVGFWSKGGEVKASRVITFSAPIRDPGLKTGPVRGVLALTFRIEKLFPWVRDAKLLEHGLVALIDDEGFCVWHRDIDESGEDLTSSLESELFPQRRGDTIVMLRAPSSKLRRTIPKLHPVYAGRLRVMRQHYERVDVIGPGENFDTSRDAETFEMMDFADPLNDKTYLASFAYLPKNHWGLVVQHEQGDALAAYELLSGGVRLIGWLSYLAVAVLVIVLWSVIFRRWRREERFAHA